MNTILFHGPDVLGHVSQAHRLVWLDASHAFTCALAGTEEAAHKGYSQSDKVFTAFFLRGGAKNDTSYATYEQEQGNCEQGFPSSPCWFVNHLFEVLVLLVGRSFFVDWVHLDLADTCGW